MEFAMFWGNDSLVAKKPCHWGFAMERRSHLRSRSLVHSDAETCCKLGPAMHCKNGNIPSSGWNGAHGVQEHHGSVPPVPAATWGVSWRRVVQSCCTCLLWGYQKVWVSIKFLSAKFGFTPPPPPRKGPKMRKNRTNPQNILKVDTFSSGGGGWELLKGTCPKGALEFTRISLEFSEFHQNFTRISLEFH